MKYTPDEVAKLLANRPNQPHYIEALIGKCVKAAVLAELEAQLESIGAGGVGPLMAPATAEDSLVVGVIGWKNQLPNPGTVVHWTALMPPFGTKLYTHPQPPRQPLTDDQHERLMRGRSTLEYGRSVERAHGIK